MSMSKVKLPLFPALVIVAVLAAGAAFDEYDIRQESEQVVLYKIHRGGRETLKKAIRELFDLAKDKKIATKGHFTLVALNDPSQSSQHMLTEIQIPVDVDASEMPAGPFEDRMTDIKTIPPHEVAFWPTRRGQTPPESFSKVYQALYRWIVARGETPMFGPRRTFFVNYYRDDYEQMQTEILVPVWRTRHPPG
jgi:effector-binding domain-containing protein